MLTDNLGFDVVLQVGAKGFPRAISGSGTFDAGVVTQPRVCGCFPECRFLRLHGAGYSAISGAAPTGAGSVLLRLATR